MKNYKVCVYAITLNEEKFVNTWYESMKEADKIIVLDTGSTDNTVNLLESLGVEVHTQNFSPWRFDDARNEALNLVSDEYDICVCTDLDEEFNKGWKEELLKVWNDNITRVRYVYNWSFDEYGNPATTFLLNKIHKNKMYKWTHPVHEVLTPLDKEVDVICNSIILNHHPDKTKSRSSYLPLLELSVKEDPLDDRNMHYLGREYMYYQKWDECIKTLKKHLALPSAIWKDERCASMRFIARSYAAKGKVKKAKEWYQKAVLEAPYLREAYIELAYLYYNENDYNKAYNYLQDAFKIKEKSNSYINEEFAWNAFIYDLLSVCAFNIGKYEEALENVKIALKKDPNNLRLKLNLEEIEKYVN